MLIKFTNPIDYKRNLGKFITMKPQPSTTTANQPNI